VGGGSAKLVGGEEVVKLGALALHAGEDLALQARGEALRILADGERGVVQPGRRSRGFRRDGVHGSRVHG
jgi:hypothetical protein